MAVDPHDLLPKHKQDMQGAQAVITLGYPAVAPVLRDLLTWLQDMNWPIARPIAEFLTSIPEPMAPLIWEVLRGDDEIWKYWCISYLISEMPPSVAEQFREELTRLAQRPTPRERSEELNEKAQEALDQIWPPTC